MHFYCLQVLQEKKKSLNYLSFALLKMKDEKKKKKKSLYISIRRLQIRLIQDIRIKKNSMARIEKKIFFFF